MNILTRLMYPIQSFFSQYIISFHDHGLGFSFLCFHFMIWMQIVRLCHSSIQPHHLLFTRLNLVFHGCPCLSPKYFQLLLMDLVFFWPFNFCIVDIRASLSLSHFLMFPLFPSRHYELQFWRYCTLQFCELLHCGSR